MVDDVIAYLTQPRVDTNALPPHMMTVASVTVAYNPFPNNYMLHRGAGKLIEMTNGAGANEPIGVPSFYFNGFQIGLSNADVNGVLLLNNVPTIGISMSYTTAKTLAIALNEMVETLEKVTGRDIMTTQQVASGLESITNQGGGNGNLR